MTTLASRSSRLSASWPVIVVWIAMLLVSTLPNILWQEVVGEPAAWLFWAKEGLLAILLLVSLRWRPLRLLRPFLIIVTVIYAAEWITGWLGGMALWQQWFDGALASFSRDMMSTQLLRLLVSVVVIAALLALRKGPRQIFLVAGDVHAPAGAVDWLGIEQGTPWSRVGAIWSLYIGGGLLVFLVVAARSMLGALPQTLPLLPAVLLFAALNAFNEEMTYRASFLSTLEEPIGRRQAVLLAAVFFGLGHYYGVPYGVVGVAMAGFLGWFLGKSMVETRGLFWPWFIHFVQDVLIFSFMAAGSVTAGGA